MDFFDVPEEIAEEQFGYCDMNDDGRIRDLEWYCY
jgi:hypothetical protein